MKKVSYFGVSSVARNNSFFMAFACLWHGSADKMPKPVVSLHLKCSKTKLKVTRMANHNKQNQHNEPIRTQTQCALPFRDKNGADWFCPSSTH